MEETKDDICEKLDKVLLEFFETLTKLYQNQAMLDQSMKSGYLNLSRARYNMGIKAVGIEQCDETKMSALLTVKVTNDNIFTVENGDVHDLETDLSDLDFKKSDDSSRSTVRRRNVKKTDVEQEHIEEIPARNDEICDENKISIDRRKVDPLRWFGVLVPLSLRQSQSDFKAAAAMALDIATLKTKLQSLGQKYKSLLKTKETFL